MSEMRTRGTPPASADSAACSLARIPPRGRSVGDQSRAHRPAVSRRSPRPSRSTPATSATSSSSVGAERDGDRRRRVVAVDVERRTERAGRVAAHRRDHRQIAARQQVPQKRDVDASSACRRSPSARRRAASRRSAPRPRRTVRSRRFRCRTSDETSRLFALPDSAMRTMSMSCSRRHATSVRRTSCSRRARPAAC